MATRQFKNMGIDELTEALETAIEAEDFDKCEEIEKYLDTAVEMKEKTAEKKQEFTVKLNKAKTEIIMPLGVKLLGDLVELVSLDVIQSKAGNVMRVSDFGTIIFGQYHDILALSNFITMYFSAHKEILTQQIGKMVGENKVSLLVRQLALINAVRPKTSKGYSQEGAWIAGEFKEGDWDKVNEYSLNVLGLLGDNSLKNNNTVPFDVDVCTAMFVHSKDAFEVSEVERKELAKVEMQLAKDSVKQ